MRSMVMAALVGVLLASPAAAQTEAEIEDSAQGAFEMARSFSRCAGFWDFMSHAEQATGNPASAQHAHNIGNGARISAGYMLSMRHRIQRPDEPPRAYGSWDEFIEPLAEVTATEMMAAIERNDNATLEQRAVTCRAMGEVAQEIIDRVRAEWEY
ncbi:MAG: hypothetical protein ACOYKM_01345 [Caulobacterales bacterium]